MKKRPGRSPAGATATVEQLVNQALVFHSEGNLGLAEVLYRDALRRAPKHSQALGMLGLVEAQKGNTDIAAQLLGQSVEIDPNNAATQFNLGLLHQQNDRNEEALKCFDRAVALKPDAAQARNNRGMVLKTLGQHEEALASYEEAIHLQPDYAEALNNKGVALRHLHRHEEAAVILAQALRLRPRAVEIHNNLGHTFYQMDRFEEALACFARAVELNPVSVEALMNLGVSLYELRRHDEARASYLRALELEPGNLDVHVNLGNVLLELNLHAQALESYQRVIDARPADQDVLMNMGNALRDLHRYPEALQYYVRALASDPTRADVRWNQALCLLAMGDFEPGLEGFEWRRKLPGVSETSRHFDAPAWQGIEPLGGKTLLLHAEQGLGDTIQFCRFTRQLAALGAIVVLEVQRPLARLVQDLQGVQRVIVRGEKPPNYDYHCPLLSLPWALGIRLDTIAAPDHYLQPDPTLTEKWRPVFEGKRRPRIGLAWSGNASYKNDHRRSIPLAKLLPALPQGNFWSLQKEISLHDQHLIDQTDRIQRFESNDFEHTAAQISHMDAVVSVDTSVAHLAAALGKPTLILLAYSADWRWMWPRTDSPWYPSVTLFRQTIPGDWDSALRGLAARIAASAPS